MRCYIQMKQVTLSPTLWHRLNDWYMNKFRQEQLREELIRDLEYQMLIREGKLK